MPTLTLEAATFRTADEILALVRRFEDCTLPREEWTHAAHLTVALWHLLQFDWPEACAASAAASRATTRRTAS